MAKFDPTYSQQQAIDSRGSAILVSAGAGSGKTRVITERLMKRICEGEDVDSFLIITYTRAAAAELKSRIMEELAQLMAQQPDNRRLRRQLALCSRAQIGTIHSFCASLLRENCHLLGLSPDFKIVDEERAMSMKNAALERVMESRYSDPDGYPGFLALADSVGAGRDDSRLVKLALSLHGKIQCHARPEKWAREQVALMSEAYSDVGDTPWGREILSQVENLCAYWLGELERLMAEMAEYEKISAAYLASFSETAEGISRLLYAARAGWDRARACLPVAFPRLGILRNSPDPELSDRLKLRRTACKKAMESIEKSLYASSDELLCEIASTAPAMDALLSLVLDFDKAYSKDKRRTALVDYSDLEHMAAQLLTEDDGSPSELARRLSTRYSEIMVDEYQDVSRVQDAIFSALSQKGKNLFFVGDVKQSIYRFRLADPTIFTEKYLSYSDCHKAGEAEPRRIMLRENFRSRREILDCANAVFSLCMSRELGELDYDEAASLKQGAVYEDAGEIPQLMLLELDSPDEEQEQSPDKTAMEAVMVGRKIIELMDSGMTVQGRPLAYGDICLLMRSANSVGGIYRRALSEMGIPVSAGQSGEFFTSIEISLMLSMLAVIDNPHQDIALIAVLRSVAFGFDPDELSEIRSKNRNADFYTALCAAAESDGKCAAFVNKLNELRSIAPDMSAAELVWRLINELDMLALCSAMTDGGTRRENLMELLELAQRFEGSGHKGLHRFVLWLRQLADKDQSAGRSGSSGTGVQIMTVHKSKGLEFPVVFLCDTARRFNRQDSMEAVLVHPQLGLGAKVTDRKKHIEYPSLARNAIRLRQEREMLSEEMRLLYVALTRPRERLYITAAVKSPYELIKTSEAAVSVPMPPQVLSSASAPVNWLIYAALADREQHIKISVHQNAELLNPTTPDELFNDDGAELRADFFKERLSFVYPHTAAQSLPSKLTATEIKGRREKDEDSLNAAPAVKQHFRRAQLIAGDKAAKPTERGIATHLALQYMDFEKTGSPESIHGEIERLSRLRFITAREASLVDEEAILELFASPLGRRMQSADKVHREFKFSVLVDASGFYPDAGEEQLLLQGVVDCCLEEKGKLVIIDYKTDNVRTEAEIKARADIYARQVSIYAMALRKIFNMEVAECLLYFLSAGKMLQIAEKDLHY